MVLLEHGLDDESAFKTALRDGRQSRARRVVEETLNEALRLRSSYEMVASQGQVQWDASEFAWNDPVDEIERAKKRESEAEERDNVEEDIFADLGFT